MFSKTDWNSVSFYESGYKPIKHLLQRTTLNVNITNFLLFILFNDNKPNKCLTFIYDCYLIKLLYVNLKFFSST